MTISHWSLWLDTRWCRLTVLRVSCSSLHLWRPPGTYIGQPLKSQSGSGGMAEWKWRGFLAAKCTRSTQKQLANQWLGQAVWLCLDWWLSLWFRTSCGTFRAACCRLICTSYGWVLWMGQSRGRRASWKQFRGTVTNKQCHPSRWKSLLWLQFKPHNTLNYDGLLCFMSLSRNVAMCIKDSSWYSGPWHLHSVYQMSH